MNKDLYRYNPFFSREIINIYHSWININKSLYLKYYNLIGIILMSLLIPFDFILYKENKPTYDSMMTDQINKSKNKEVDLQSIIEGPNSWNVK